MTLRLLATVGYTSGWTPCVPVLEALRDLRKCAIQQMRKIYEQAASILVLDAELQLMCSVQDSPEKMVMRLYGSAWGRRIWTLQEGILGYGRLPICLSDGILPLLPHVRSCRAKNRNQT